MLGRTSIPIILFSLGFAALFIAANVTESENPIANYEANSYSHFGCPWTAIIMDDDVDPTSPATLKVFDTTDGDHELTALEFAGPRGKLIVLCWPLLKDLLFAVALFMPIAAWSFVRRRGVTLRRIHVRTALLLMLLAGALLGVNLRERACNYYGAPAQEDKIECFCRGWPCDTMREWPNHFSAERFTEIEKFGIVMDIVVAALLLFTVAVVCEALPGAVTAPKSSPSRRSADCIRT